MEEMKIVTLLLFICGFALAQTSQSYPDSDAIVFPGPTNARSARLKTFNIIGGLTVKLAKTINSINSVEDFLKFIDGVPKDHYDVLIGSRFGEEGERSNAIVAKPAHCVPELQPVSFATEDSDRSIIYYPSCTRIKRCGGCCSHALLSCQPTATVLQNFIVQVTKINSNGGLTYREKRVIPLEEHTACECDCTTKPEHCTGKQKYIEDECTCACTNVDEEQKCRKFSETKLWDPAQCACLCRNVQECSPELDYDRNTCRCQDQRSFHNRRRSGYQVPGTSRPRDSSLPFIIPLEASNRRRQNKNDPEYK